MGMFQLVFCGTPEWLGLVVVKGSGALMGTLCTGSNLETSIYHAFEVIVRKTHEQRLFPASQ